MKWRSTAEIKKIKGVEIGGGYQIWDMNILIKKHKKKNVWFLLPVLSSFAKRDPGFCANYIRDYNAIKNYNHTWIYYIWSAFESRFF